MPEVAKRALPRAQLNSDWGVVEASKRESEIWELQSIPGRPKVQEQFSKGGLGRGDASCRSRKAFLPHVFSIAEPKSAYKGVKGTAGIRHANHGDDVLFGDTDYT